MKVAPSVFLGLMLGTIPATAFADNSDPAAARAQLEQGFALRKQGKCDEAIPHFVESARLDRQPKVMLNLADCEEKVGRLVNAESHFVEARDLAQTQKLFDLRTEAERRLAIIEKKIPKLTVRLAAGAPADTKVLRDGVELGAVSLGTPLPIDAGTHKLVARSASQEREYEIAVSEGETRALEVTPTGGRPVELSTAGMRTDGAAASPNSPPPQPANPPLEPAEASTSERTSNGHRTLAYALLGTGAVGLGAGTVFLLQFISKRSEANDICNLQGACPRNQQSQVMDLDHRANTAGTLSAVGFAVGGVALTTAIVLMLRKEPPASSAALIEPWLGANAAGVSGRF